MKKKIGIALVLAMVLVIGPSVPAMAWEIEDTLVADNEDFVAAGGFDGGVGEFTCGEQDFWQGGPVDLRTPDGYNLYRGDVTNSGNLDSVFVTTTTPGEIDLPGIIPYPGPGSSGYWIMFDTSPDTWYWALAPRVYVHTPDPYIWIVLPDASVKVDRWGTMRYADIDFNDGTWRIQIPAGVRIWNVKGGGATKLYVDENGNIRDNVWFMRGEPIVTRIGF